MEVGASVWVRDPEQSWVSSTVISKDEDGGTFKITVSDKNSIKREFTCRLDLSSGSSDFDGIKLQNDSSEATVENLINLPYLHEPAILHCLQNRYVQGDIYTYTGPILIALNPFKSLPLYTPQILESYYNFGLLTAQGIDGGRPLPPHVYAVADAAYRDMMKVISNSSNSKTTTAVNQTILISGESGAGKTESTKIVLRYLTTVGNSSGNAMPVTGSVMDKVLQSNPILESFGNAKTLRNDNSSRFGKFIELHFSKRGHLIGASIRTYLLEKVRLAAQQLGERNFHIMYQLIVGCTTEEKQKWQLGSARDYWCCNQGDVYTLKSVDDAKEFSDLRVALNTLNFAPEDQQSLFGSIAGLLHLSEVAFTAHKTVEEGCAVTKSAKVDMHFAAVAQLCGFSPDQLERVLTVRLVTANKESYDIKLTAAQAVEARDALSKALYSRLFEWIVLSINESIRVDDATKIRAEIGVLDIFGFESFKTNSFEQLCINYTNETLQQQFNQFVFKLEQSEYQREEISWSFIEFPDNQDCLDLIEHKQNGILSVLDDVCKLGQATDEKFANRLYKLLESNPRFTASKSQRIHLVFCVTHYAGPVEYLTTSFVDKNKNELPKEAATLFRNSSLSLLSTIFAENWSPIAAGDRHAPSASAGGTASSSTAGGKVSSVSTQFKQQLAELMAKVSSTMPHYIRCLKPNDENVPDKFHRRRTTEQLRYGGVLEAVRVARSGFPVRLSHSDFFSRYRCVANPFNKLTASLPASIDVSESLNGSNRVTPRKVRVNKDSPDKNCRSLLLSLWDQETGPDPGGKMSREVSAWLGARIVTTVSADGTGISTDSIQCGLTKVFLRKPAHDMLEGRRSRKLRAAVGRLQCTVRGYPVRKHYLATLQAAGVIQRMSRGYAARQVVKKLRRKNAELKAALSIQTVWRCRFLCRRYNKLRRAALSLQCLLRIKVAKAKVLSLLTFKRTVRLQSVVRGALAKIKWGRLKRAIVALQCALRCKRSKLVLKSLKASAKDVGKLQMTNDALKQEIEQLRARAKDETRRMQVETDERSAAAAVEEMNDLRTELAALRAELESEKSTCRSLTSELATAVGETEAAVSQRADMLAIMERRKDEMKEELRRVHREAEEEVRKLKAEICDMKDRQVVGTTKDIRAQPIHHTALTHSHFTESTVSKSQSHPNHTEAAALSTSTSSAVSVTATTTATSTTGNNNSSGSSSSSSNGTGDDVIVDRSIKANASEVATFERNLVNLRSKLKIGLKVVLWEEGHNGHECTISLDKGYEALVFAAAGGKKGFASFLQKAEVAPIKIKDIDEHCAGAAPSTEVGYLSVFGYGEQLGSADQNAIDTLTIKIGAKVVDGESTRVVVLKLANRADRDFLHSAISTMISDMHVSRGKNANAASGSRSAAATSPTTNRPTQLNATGQSLNRLSREASMKSNADSTASDEGERNSELHGQLQAERTNFAKVMQQIFALTNDLNDKDDVIVKLKREVAALERAVYVKEREHEQDSIVKVQLGKRLEQVLLDKEEAYEELEQLQVKLSTLKSAMSNMDFRANAALTISPARK